MRLGVSDPGSSEYLNQEVLLNNIKRISIASGTDEALAVAIVDSDGNMIESISPMASAVVSGFKDLTSAGTAVQINAASVAIKWVDVCAHAGTIAVGDSTVVQTAGSERGTIIYPGNIPHRIYLDNINKLYAAGPTGTRISFSYYTNV